uniref:GG16946 n=1 Tax=Drosophila erecta TaxID=7220 RepID=B3P3U5_DROER
MLAIHEHHQYSHSYGIHEPGARHTAALALMCFHLPAHRHRIQCRLNIEMWKFGAAEMGTPG